MKKLFLMIALLCAVIAVSGCSSNASVSSAAESSTVVSTATPDEVETTSAEEFKAIPDNAFRFSSSEYSGSDFLWYTYNYGYTIAAHCISVYRYEDYLIFYINHYRIGDGSEGETRFLTEEEGNAFLANATDYTRIEQDTSFSWSTQPVGSLFDNARICFKSEGYSFEVEQVDLSSISYELPNYDEQDPTTLKYVYEYPLSRSDEIFTDSDETLMEYRQMGASNGKSDLPLISGSSDILEIIAEGIENITGEEVETAHFKDITADKSTLEVTLEGGSSYTVVVNPIGCVLDIY